MAVLSKLFRRGRGAKAAPLVRTTPVLVEMLRAFDGSVSNFGNVYRSLAPVRTVVDFLADAVSTTSLKVYRRTATGRMETRNHGVARLLRHPNDDITTQTLIGGTVRDLGVYGNAYWRKMESSSSLWVVPLPPERVVPRGGSVVTNPTQYDLWLGTTPVTVPADEIVHFRFYNPEDRRVGVSKLMALRTILAEEIAGSEHREGFWRNAARRDGVIERPLAQDGVKTPEWDDIARKRFREQWQGRTSGADNAGITPVLEDGMKWVPDSFSPKDSEFIEGRKFILEAVARVFNVPPQLLGLTGTATFASQREFAKWLYKGTLPPWYELIQSEIERQILPWFGEDPAETDVFVEFLAESKLQGDFVDQAAIVLGATGRPYMEVFEARNLFNLPDRRDETDHELAIPINNVALGAPSQPEVEPAKALMAFLERQERSVLSKAGAGKEFDIERWNRELGRIIPPGLAQQMNARIASVLAETGDPRPVFARLKAAVGDWADAEVEVLA